jgi:gliding motility associated protien GldN
LFKHLLDGILSESLKAYHVENDRFTKPLGTDEVRAMLTKREDILVVDVVTGRDSVVRVESMIDWEEVKQFRIKETWYVDSRTGKLEGIITGIAPLREMVNAEGVVVMDKPLFWIYFPAARSYLSKFRVEAQGGNQSTTLSWTDWLDLRYFSGRVTKESNVLDARLKDRYSGREMLMQGEAANRAIFDFEHDLFSY